MVASQLRDCQTSPQRSSPKLAVWRVEKKTLFKAWLSLKAVEDIPAAQQLAARFNSN